MSRTQERAAGTDVAPCVLEGPVAEHGMARETSFRGYSHPQAAAGVPDGQGWAMEGREWF